jgi:hypothetical protein
MMTIIIPRHVAQAKYCLKPVGILVWTYFMLLNSAVGSESEGLLGGVGVEFCKNVPTPTPTPTSI